MQPTGHDRLADALQVIGNPTHQLDISGALGVYTLLERAAERLSGFGADDVAAYDLAIDPAVHDSQPYEDDDCVPGNEPTIPVPSHQGSSPRATPGTRARGTALFSIGRRGACGFAAGPRLRRSVGQSEVGHRR